MPDRLSKHILPKTKLHNEPRGKEKIEKCNKYTYEYKNEIRISLCNLLDKIKTELKVLKRQHYNFFQSRVFGDCFCFVLDALTRRNN